MHTPVAGLKDRIKGKPVWGGQHRNWAKEEEEERQRIKKEKETEQKKRKEEDKSKPAVKKGDVKSETQSGKDEDQEKNQEKNQERKAGGATADEDKGRGDKKDRSDQT
jgi:hypothetical protein